MLVEILLEFLVGIVDVKLFKPVHLQDGRSYISSGALRSPSDVSDKTNIIPDL